MAFPTQALLHRLRKHSDTQSWRAKLPARFHEDVGAWGSRLGQGGSLGASRAPLAGLRSSLVLGGRQHDIAGRVWTLSRDACGCREVQQALEEAGDDEQRWALAAELHGHVREAARCPHANHVVQKWIKVMPPSMSQFIIDEIMEDGDLIALSKHKFGCRIIQRLLEMCLAEQVHDLVELLLAEFLLISTHAYGNFVVQCLLQNIDDKQRTRLVDLVEQHLPELALRANGCAVICAALEQHGDCVDRGILAEMMLEDSDRIVCMADSRHGETFIANLLDVVGDAGCHRLCTLLQENPKLEAVLQQRSQ